MSPVDLSAEFWRAIRFVKAAGAKDPRLLWPIQRVQFGFARVEFYGLGLYEPDPGGRVMAVIAPVVEDGELIDLCAIDPYTQHIGTRLGYGRGLGLPAVDKARMGYELKLKARPLDWLRDPVDSCYLFDLATVQAALDGVAVIACADLEHSDRVAAFLPPSERHRAQVA
jgi:hypothetical protein